MVEGLQTKLKDEQRFSTLKTIHFVNKLVKLFKRQDQEYSQMLTDQGRSYARQIKGIDNLFRDVQHSLSHHAMGLLRKEYYKYSLAVISGTLGECVNCTTRMNQGLPCIHEINQHLLAGTPIPVSDVSSKWTVADSFLPLAAPFGPFSRVGGMFWPFVMLLTISLGERIRFSFCVKF